MNTISISYAVVWQIDFAPEYKWSKCGKCFNSKTGSVLKITTMHSEVFYANK